jgi:hypothetical protein
MGVRKTENILNYGVLKMENILNYMLPQLWA